MPLDKLVLILVIVVAAAGVTVWLGATLIAMWQVPALGILSLIALAIALYVAIRLVLERVRGAEDDHYDRIEK